MLSEKVLSVQLEINLHLAVLSYKAYAAMDEFWSIGQFVTPFVNHRLI